jgi:hypothetical protein
LISNHTANPKKLDIFSENYKNLIFLAQKQVYSLKINGFEIYEISFNNFNQHSVIYSKMGFGSEPDVYNIYGRNVLSIIFKKKGTKPFNRDFGKLKTYLCKNEDELQKLISVFKIEEFKTPTFRYDNFFIASTISKNITEDEVEFANKIFSNLTNISELPTTFFKYFDSIDYFFNFNKNFNFPNGFPNIYSLTYKKSHRRIYYQSANDFILVEKLLFKLSPFYEKSKVNTITFTEFDSVFFKQPENSKSEWMKENVKVAGLTGCFRTIITNTKSRDSTNMTNKYYHSIFFRFDNVLLYFTLPMTYEEIDFKTKKEWINIIKKHIKFFRPYLGKNLPIC